MKTTSNKTMKTLRIIARVMSAIIIGFSLIMFIGETIESNKRGTAEPLTMYTIVQLILFGIVLLGLALAWKWELLGGILSVLAIIGIFIVNPSAILWPMFIFPANAILFIAVAYMSKEANKNIVEEIKT